MFTKIKLAIPTYYVGRTTPGIMPDLRPREFDSLLEAKAYLIEEIDDYVDLMRSEKHARLSASVTPLRKFIENKPQECNVPVGDYVFWITKE